MTTPCGPYSANRVAKVAKAVMSEHEWRWALRDRRTQEGVRIACSAPGCEWSAERPGSWTGSVGPEAAGVSVLERFAPMGPTLLTDGEPCNWGECRKGGE